MVGKTAAEISNQVIIKLEFYDYQGNKINATSSLVIRADESDQFNVITTFENHVIGERGSQPYQVRWQMIDGDLIAKVAPSTNPEPITAIYYFKLQEIQANDKSYTKFKYIQ